MENKVGFFSREETTQILLAEYKLAQESAQHHDNLIWRNTSIIATGNFFLLGFIVNNLDKTELRWVFVAISFLGIALSILVWRAVFIWNDVMGQKYTRCRTIESTLGMWQHRGLIYKKNRQKQVYSFVMLCLMFLWMVILIKSILPLLGTWAGFLEHVWKYL